MMRYQCRRRCTFSECRQASELISLSVRCCPELELIRTNFRDAHPTPAELASVSVRPIFFWARTFGVGGGEKGVLGPLSSVRYDSRRTTDKAILLNQRGKRDGQGGKPLDEDARNDFKKKKMKRSTERWCGDASEREVPDQSIADVTIDLVLQARANMSGKRISGPADFVGKRDDRTVATRINLRDH